MTPNVELHIAELVLEGFAPADRDRIGAAVRRELARLLGEKGPPTTWGQNAASPRVDGGTIRVAPGATADAIGTQLAHAVYGGLGR